MRSLLKILIINLDKANLSFIKNEGQDDNFAISICLWINTLGTYLIDDIGVSDGAWTRDIPDHNRVLYQLSYAHHALQII